MKKIFWIFTARFWQYVASMAVEKALQAALFVSTRCVERLYGPRCESSWREDYTPEELAHYEEQNYLSPCPTCEAWEKLDDFRKAVGY